MTEDDAPLVGLSAAPAVADRLEANFKLPALGWITVELKAADQTFEFQASYAFDPFREMVGWLEAVAVGGDPELCIEVESAMIDFLILDPAPDSVRFVIVLWGNEDVRRVALDVRIARVALSTGIYRPLMHFWRSDGLREFWDQWDDRPGPYSLGSSQLDLL